MLMSKQLSSLPPACGINVHSRCVRMVGTNCGINNKDLAKVMEEMGVTPDKLRAQTSLVSLSTFPPCLVCVSSAVCVWCCVCTFTNTYIHVYAFLTELSCLFSSPTSLVLYVYLSQSSLIGLFVSKYMYFDVS